MSSATSGSPSLFAPPLLATKLRAPRLRPELVGRPALLDLLDHDPERLLTVVHAPAGSGKTTLVAQWLADTGHDLAHGWVSLDADDNDPGRVWSYVVAALGEAQPGLDDEELLALRLPGLDPRESVLPALLNQIDAFDPPAVLVLDDYHLIEDERIHGSMEFLLDHLSGGLSLVLVSRTSPPLPLARLRTQGRLAEIDAADLRFGPRAARELIGGIGVHLEPSAVRRLVERTEGWGAGLYLAGLSLRGRADPDGFIDGFAGDHRQVVDYLAEEVLTGLDDAVREFVVGTSVFERFSAPLADAALGRADGAAMLGEIERTNLFLIPLDDKRRWYRYHHLFRDLLRAELNSTRTPAEIAQLHGRAGQWLAESGSVDEAIGHLVAGGAAGEAGDLVARDWGIMHLEGWLEQADRWLRLIPEETREADVRLCLAGAWIAISLGQLENAERWLAAAERADDVDDPCCGASSCDSSRAAARAYIGLFRGNAAAAEASAREAVELEHGTPEWQSVARMALGLALLDLMRTDEAERLLNDVVALGEQTPWRLPALVALSSLAGCQIMLGDFDQAERLAARALELAETEKHEEFPHGASAHLTMGRVLVERGEHDRGIAMTARGIELIERGSAPGPRAFARVQSALVRVRTGDVQGAGGELDRARALLATLDGVAGPLTEFLRQLDREIDGNGPAERTGPTLGDELSERERAVLRLLTGSGSLREIADSIYVSHNTIKTQVRSIYRKLGVSDRSEAVARGRELGVL